MAKPKGPDNGDNKLAETMYQRGLFLNMALNMSWQLALVVIIPIVGGDALDKHFKTAPWLTVIGAVLAALGVAAILRQTVKQAAMRTSSPKKRGSQ